MKAASLGHLTPARNFSELRHRRAPDCATSDLVIRHPAAGENGCSDFSAVGERLRGAAFHGKDVAGFCGRRILAEALTIVSTGASEGLADCRRWTPERAEEVELSFFRGGVNDDVVPAKARDPIRRCPPVFERRCSTDLRAIAKALWVMGSRPSAGTDE